LYFLSRFGVALLSYHSTALHQGDWLGTFWIANLGL
jgi:hypothetical protein